MMANRIDHLLFWTGGVVLPRLSQLALAALAQSGGNLALEARLLDLEHRADRGDVGLSEFCELAASAAGAPGTARTLMESMLAGSKAQPGMVALLGDLVPHLRLGLLSNYWQSLLQPILTGPELARFFVPADIHFSSDHRGADFFEALVAEGVIRPGHTLCVDYHAPRAMTVIRRGIDAAIFVDARRLRRDLGLWGLLPFESG